MNKWRHFTDREVAGLKDDVVYKLERARDFFQAPIVITSGYRPPDRNAAVGGVEGSAHTFGMAVDIRCSDKELQIKLAWALGCAGFHRIGVYDRHIHVDVDGCKPTPSYWTGVSK